MNISNSVFHCRTYFFVMYRVETIDGSAKEQEDYEPLNEMLTFEPDEREKEVSVKIVDDNQWEPDEEFFVKLTLVPGKESEDVRLGRTSIMEITILNDDGNDCFGCSMVEKLFSFFFFAIMCCRAWYHSVREAWYPGQRKLWRG